PAARARPGRRRGSPSGSERSWASTRLRSGTRAGTRSRSCTPPVRCGAARKGQMTPRRRAGSKSGSCLAWPTPSTTAKSFANRRDDGRHVLLGARGAALLKDEPLARLVEDRLVPLDDRGGLSNRVDGLNQVEVRLVDQAPRDDVPAKPIQQA